MELSSILYLKFPEADFINQIVIRDDGSGQYIYKWDNSFGDEPTDDDLKKWSEELIVAKANHDAILNRQENYPPIGDQLDMLYKAMESGELPKVDDFYNAIRAVKEKYPKL